MNSTGETRLSLLKRTRKSASFHLVSSAVTPDSVTLNELTLALSMIDWCNQAGFPPHNLRPNVKKTTDLCVDESATSPCSGVRMSLSRGCHQPPAQPSPARPAPARPMHKRCMAFVFPCICLTSKRPCLYSQHNKHAAASAGVPGDGI